MSGTTSQVRTGARRRVEGPGDRHLRLVPTGPGAGHQGAGPRPLDRLEFARAHHPAGKGREEGDRSPSSRPHAGREPLRVPGEPPLRLTRRGRLALRVALVTLLVLAMAVAILVLGRPARAGTDGRPLPVSYHVVQPGETLWEIAGRVAPGADRRDTVLRIVELNALPSSSVTAGQELALPRW